MPAETVRVDWIQDQEFLLKDRFGFPILMTQPMGVNGADLLPLSVIGCAAWDLAAMLKKQRQQVSALQVTAECEREEGPPWRFLRIHILYRISGRGLNSNLIQRDIELSEQKYCSTFATVRDAVEISSAYEIHDEDVDEERGEIGETSTPGASGNHPAIQAVIDLTEALNAGDVEAVMRLMAEGCIFENTYPAPDGRRYEGKASVRAFWEEFFQSSNQPKFEIEEIFASGDRCILRWLYHWQDAEGRRGHVRGVDVYRVREGLIIEKLSYVKG